MTTNGTSGHDIDVQDLEYLRHGERPLLARLYTPRGDGPFPMVVDLHGGAWCRGDRTNDLWRWETGTWGLSRNCATRRGPPCGRL